MKLKHIYREGSQPLTLLLLHGTGGNEYDLLPLAEMIAPEAGILSVRGNVLENGMPRFFRRIREGVFDEEDLLFRTKELYEFLHEAEKRYSFDKKKVIALGYSNGANIAASLLFHESPVFAGAMLFHPMVPRKGIVPPLLDGLPVFIAAGKNDPICPREETEHLYELLQKKGGQCPSFLAKWGARIVATGSEGSFSLV